MFEKLLSNLPYNPSLVHQLGFYAKRMRREESIRRTGFAFIVLTFVIQFFAVIAPPQPTVADSINDLVDNGISGPQDAAKFCRNDTRHYGDILLYYGISCTEVAAASTVSLKSTDYNGELYSMGWKPLGATYNGKPTKEEAVPIPGTGGTLYWRLLHVWDTGASSTYKALKIPANSKHGAFWILYNCGNLVHIKVPKPYVPPTPPKQPPPPPPAVLSCSDLTMNYQDNQTVEFGSSVVVRGQAAGQNIKAGQKVDMYYDYVNTDTGKVVASANSLGVPFSGTTADDSQAHSFTANSAGKFAVKLTVKYNSNQVANGSGTGNCIKHVTVGSPCQYDTSLPPSSDQCKPCAQSTNSQDTAACIERHKSANDTTAGWTVDNDEVKTAQPGDSITYTLTVKNTGKATFKQYPFEEDMSDVLDYVQIKDGKPVMDLHGGNIDANNLVSWETKDIAPNETVTHQITIQVANPIPSTPASPSDASHFDLIMTNKFSNTINIKVPGPVVKEIQVVTATKLPNTGPGSSLMIAGAVVVVAGYFFARTRLLADESLIAVQQTANHGGM